MNNSSNERWQQFATHLVERLNLATARAEAAEQEVERIGTVLHRAMWALHQADAETAAALELDMLKGMVSPATREEQQA